MSPGKFLSAILTIVLLIAGGIVHRVSTAAGFPGEVLPATEIVSGWVMEEGIRHFNRDNLFDHINGEAEIYLPYGFEDLATARYADKKNARSGIVADVYRMGSRLDAFGIYSNYRRADDAEKIAAGNEGFVSASQLLFYQDRYFIRLSASGDINPDRNSFVAFAHAVSRNLPVSENPPGELSCLRVDGVKDGSERYIARSLLGYSFLRSGITADAVQDGDKMQVFVVFEGNSKLAREAFDQYGGYLKESGKEVKLSEERGRVSLTAEEPLYQKVYLLQSGRYLVGAVRFKDAVSAEKIVKKIGQKTDIKH